MKTEKTKKHTASDIPIHCTYNHIANVDEMKLNLRNPNKHPEDQLKLYGKIIHHQGWRRAVVISRQSGLVVTGHGAVEAARLMGWKEVPVDEQDFASEADEWAHLLADNRLAELAEMDQGDLVSLLK
mgnify:FL=1